MLSFFNQLHLIITLFCQLWNAARTSPTWMARAAGRLAMNRLSCSLKSWKRKITATVYVPIWHGHDQQARQIQHPRAARLHTEHSSLRAHQPRPADHLQRYRGETQPLGYSHCKRSGKTPFSCACFSDPESSTIVTAHTFSIDFTGLKWFRYSQGSSDHTAEDGLWPQHYFCFLLHHWDMV